jgi:hypothetical protein
MNEIMVADEFSPDLGARYPEDGPFGGAEFRDQLLVPRLERAIADGTTLVVNFDCVEGIPTSFAEEAFGGLLRIERNWTADQVKRHLVIVAPNSPRLWAGTRLAAKYLAEEAARRRRG